MISKCRRSIALVINDASNDFIWDAQNNLTVSGNADITTDNYTQNGAIDVTGALTINVESDFDYVADFNGAIDFNSLNLNVGGNFINNDSANNFTWNANDSLNVSGNADITTDNYTQNGAIDVAVTLPPAVIFKLSTLISPPARFLKKSSVVISKLPETIVPVLRAV